MYPNTLYPKTLQFPTCVVVMNPPEPGTDYERKFVVFESGEKDWTHKIANVAVVGKDH